MAPPDDEPEGIAIPVAWIGVEDLPVHFVNQFIAQVDRGEVFLTMGSVVPPALLGTADERIEQAKSLTYLPIRPTVRFGMTPARVRELIGVLEITLENHEKQDEAFGDPRK